MKIRSRTREPKSEKAPSQQRGGLHLASARALLPGRTENQPNALPSFAQRPAELRQEAGATPAWMNINFSELPLNSDSLPDSALLDLAIAGTRTALPQRSTLETCFGVSLADIAVYCNPATRKALERFNAEAAVYRGRILLRESTTDLLTLSHEIAHVLQQESASISFPAELTIASHQAEAEAETLAQQVTHRALLETGGQSIQPHAFQPVTTETSLATNAIALRAPGAGNSIAVRNDSAPQAAIDSERQAANDRSAQRTEVSEAQPGTESNAQTGAARGDAGTEEQTQLLELPAPPAPGVTPEQVAAREQAMADAQAALEGAETATGVVDAFAAAPPTVKAAAAGQLSTKLNSTLQQETQTLQENTPEIHAQLSHEALAAAPALQVAAPPSTAVNIEPNPPAPAPEVSLPEIPQPGQFTANNGVVNSFLRPQTGTENRAEEGQEALRDVRTTDPGIQTSLGPAPSVPLEGETDPQRLQNQTEEGRAQARQSLAQAQQAVVQGPGPERVQPISFDEAQQVGQLAAPAVQEAPAPEGAQAYLAMNLPPEVQTAFDENTGEQMRTSVGAAQAQMQEAATQRDQQHQAEVERAQTANDQLVQQADQDQRTRVAEARDQIQTERQTTLDRQQEAVRNAETEAETRRTQDRTAIDDRVNQDREEIDGRYRQAETDAQAEVRDGERQAEDQRRQAERDAENQSWWDRAVNFIRDAFNALVNAINAVFDAVRRAVNTVLDAARDFAIGLINAAASFISRAIAAFGEFLKGLVQGLLGDLFPGLAAALTAFIDNAVAVAQRAVEVVAEGLRRGVNALVEGLRAGINGLINIWQTAVNGALAVLEAAVTGDWGALARKVFEAIMRALGIDPAAIYELIGRAQEALQTIIDDPGAFLGHVLDAVKGGIQKFADNFLTHLQAGIIGWLTGALGTAGITLPERFDLMGVLSLIQQILGLTWDNIRQRLVRLVGERGVQVIEFVAGYVQTLIEGGWAALWERIQNDLASLRDMVLEQIKNFLVERIIVAAITRLATMFNPVGAILNLVLTLYNLYTFLRDQLQRIFAVVQSVVNAISDIARGVIEPAATRIESVLAGLLPLAIDLLARLLGLGNVGERVRNILQSVQNAVWGGN